MVTSSRAMGWICYWFVGVQKTLQLYCFGPQNRMHFIRQIPGAGRMKRQAFPCHWPSVMLCSLQTHLVQVYEVNAEDSRLSSDRLCHLPGKWGLNCTTFPQLEMSGLNCIHWQDEKCVMFCLALHSRYPKFKVALSSQPLLLPLPPCTDAHLWWEDPSISVLSLHFSHPCFPLY